MISRETGRTALRSTIWDRGTTGTPSSRGGALPARRTTRIGQRLRYPYALLGSDSTPPRRSASPHL